MVKIKYFCSTKYIGYNTRISDGFRIILGEEGGNRFPHLKLNLPYYLFMYNVRTYILFQYENK